MVDGCNDLYQSLWTTRNGDLTKSDRVEDQQFWKLWKSKPRRFKVAFCLRGEGLRCCQANYVEFPRVSWNHSDHSGDTLPKPWMLDAGWGRTPQILEGKVIISLVWQLGAASQLVIIMSYQSCIWVIYIYTAYILLCNIYVCMICTHHYIYIDISEFVYGL